MANASEQAPRVSGPDRTERRGWRWLYLALASLTGLMGVVTFALGITLVVLGGTFYYLIAGALLAAGAVLAWRNNDRLALILMGLAVVLTIIWSVVEIANKGWMPAWGIDFAGRVGILTGLVAATGLACLLWRTPARATPRRWALGGVVAALVALVGIVILSWETTESPSVAAAPGAALPASVSPVTEAGADWATFGGTSNNRRYSALTQVTTANVKELEEAWTFRSGDKNPAEGRVFYSSQNTPIKMGDTLYTCTPSSHVFALDPGTGGVRWQYDPRVPAKSMESLFTAACRTVAYFDDGDPAGRPAAVSRMPAVPGVIGPVPREGSNCHHRIYVATADGRLVALDAVGGFICRDFGNNGTVDLTAGMGFREPGFASNTSGATVAGGLLIIGQQVSDNQRRDSPSGVVRA